jgi:amino acid adenylation domain-containing protein
MASPATLGETAQPIYVFPTSYAQQRLWFLNQLVPDNPFYNVDVAVRLETPLDSGGVEYAINQVVCRHEVLRTTFREVDGQPYQVIAERLHIPVQRVNLTSLPPAEREAAAPRLVSKEAQRPFDLRNGPLLRVLLADLGDHDQIFLLSLHHIVSDGWSMQVLFRELSELYSAYLSGQPARLPELTVQYADFAVWQREWLNGERYEQQLGYWKRKLNDLPILRLPADRPRPTVQNYRGATLHFTIPPAVHRNVRALNTGEGVTTFITMLASFNALLHRYTDQDDIVVGAPIANRTRAELEPLIGFFVNTLVLRTDASGNITFRELVRRVREVAIEAYAHQDLPFEKLVEELAPERDMGRNPLFQVSFQVFSHEDARSESSASDVSSARPFQVEKGTASIDLALDVSESQQSLELRVEYSSDLYNEETIVRLAEHFQTLLAAAVERPDVRVSELPLMSPDEIHRIAVEWNRTEVELPGPDCVHQLFERQAVRTPELPAVLIGGGSITYRGLNERANGTARRLRREGVRPGDMVGVCLQQSHDLPLAFLAVWKAGATVLPLHPSLPRRRLMQMAEESGCTTVLAHSRTASVLPDLHCLSVDAARADTENIALAVDSAAIAYIIYTSGSTGRPKGVAVAHKAAAHYLKWMQRELPLDQSDCVFQKYSYAFDIALWEMFGPLSAGARIVCADEGRQADAPWHVELIRSHGVTVVDLVPGLLQAWLEEPEFRECTSLRRVIVGGETLSPALMQRFFQVSSADLLNLYGPTETTMSSTWWRCHPDWQGAAIPIGRPIGNTRAYAFDRFRNLVPIGVVGELLLGGAGLARGYWNDDQLTAAKFITWRNPLGAQERLYRTGDRVRLLSDGNFEFVGRMDEQVKLRGFRVELGEIETALKQHAYVQEAAVLVIDDFPNDAHTLAHVVLTNAENQVHALVGELARLTDAEVSFLLEYETDEEERRRTVLRKHSEFEVFLRLKSDDFIRPPTDSQRNRTVQRVVDEFVDDLRHLDGLTRDSVAGSQRASIDGDFRLGQAKYDNSLPVIEGRKVMQDWERPLMRAMTGIVAESHGDVLELGFGMGISATYIQEAGVRSHTIVECNAGVVQEFERWRQRYPGRDIRLVHGRWQDVIDQLGTFDGILFDTYPISEREFTDTVLNNITFAEHFIPHAARLCRPGGVLSYYTNEIDTFSRRHQRLVLRHFRSLTLSVVEGLHPPPECNYWWAHSMVAVKALR